MNELIEIKSKNSGMGKAVILHRFYISSPVVFLRMSVWILSILSIAYLIAGIFSYIESANYLISLSIIFISFGLINLALYLFHKDLLNGYYLLDIEELEKRISQKRKANFYDSFSFDLSNATYDFFAVEGNIDTQKLVLCLLYTRDINFIVTRLGVSQKTFEGILKNFSGTAEILAVMEESLRIAMAEDHNQIEVGDVLVALMAKEPYFQKELTELKLELKDIANVAYWFGNIKEEIQSGRMFNINSLRMSGGVGRDWAFGYTLYIKNFSYDLSEMIEKQGLGLEIIGHQKEIKEIKEALNSSSGNNILVVGEPGVGKRTTVLGFAKDVVEGKTKTNLDFKHVVQIDTDSLLSGVTDAGEATERLSGVFNEAASAGNIIIYIENIQNLLSGGEGAGKINAVETILPLLNLPEVTVIGTCDVGSYTRFIAPNTALSQKFTRVNVDEPTPNEMIRILEDVVFGLEAKTDLIISYEAIKETVRLAEKYLINLPNPEKSINLLDRVAAAAASTRGKTIILPKDVADYVASKYDVPTDEVSGDESKKLLALEEEIHKSVIGQNEAVSAISNSLRRARAGVVSSKQPIGSFLFLGPTGVGKTETAKAMSQVYFKGENKMIRFDMSEYQNKEDIYRFIGSNLGGDKEPGALTTAVREHPFSLLLFDEIEKAYKDVLDLFLQILDEGFVTDGNGRKVSFSNTMIIATSNAGSELIRKSIATGVEYEKVKDSLINYLQEKGIYRPEFLNRFTAVAIFSPLSEQEIEQVAGLMIERLKTDILKNKGIEITIEPAIIPLLAKIGFDPQMGARPMARTIQEKVENMLANKILSGEIKRGDKITIRVTDIS